jgi:2-polyprenyl-3-methyl-5-hydroxy-6-metoxy-1,4-benzoquinol methylase
MNPIFGNWDQVRRKFIVPFARKHSLSNLRILDIGCGGGDVLIRLVKQLKIQGLTIDALGIDPDPHAETFRKKYVDILPEIRFKKAWSHEVDGPFDLIISNHVLHHLNELELESLKNECYRLSNGLVLLNDLSRSSLAYVLYSSVAWPLHFNSFAWVDGRISIKRAYLKTELAKIFAENWTVKGHGLFRNLLLFDAKNKP